VGLGENRVPFLRSLGKDADAIIARAHSEDIDAKIIASADEARELGLFGSPHFVVGREVFGATTAWKTLCHGQNTAMSSIPGERKGPPLQRNDGPQRLPE
jgi:hypothetical protein